MKLVEKNTETLKKYYEHVNQGDFLAVAQCLSEDVVFKVPGDTKLLPFSGEWRGREKVLELFSRFGEAFWIVGMSETRTVTTENEVFSFNDEAFKVKTTGRFYRVPVMHHMTFDENNKIKSLVNVHDTYIAKQAFTGKAAIVQPILTSDLLDGESELDEVKALNIVNLFLNKLQQKELVDEYLTANALILYPGDPTIIPFSGIWFGKEQVTDFIELKNSTIKDSNLSILQTVVNNGTVVASVKEDGLLSINGEKIELCWTVLIQLTRDEKIGRISFYLDTPLLAEKLNK